jgi:uncharacterized protein YbjT (DUF2867 family)
VNALLAGATGLVGSHCLRRLLADPAVTSVVALARRPLAVAEPKLRVELVDFARLAERAPPPATVALCALGTTIKQAGSQAAFRQVDHDAVAEFGRFALRAGCQTFVLVSSVGADPAARSFYLRVKGEAEATIGALGFPRLVVLRPSLLLGARAESRPGEAAARVLMPALAPLLIGSLRRYRGIGVDTVAAAMVAAARSQEAGHFVWEHDQIAAARPRPAAGQSSPP